MPRKTRMNNLTSSELIAQVNPENIRLKRDFLVYLKSIQRSEGTIRSYENDLDIFFVWNLKNNNNKNFVDVSKRDLVSYQYWLINDNGHSPARVRRLKASLSSLSNYIENVLDDEEGFKNYRSIVRKIESPVNQPVREKTIMTQEQLDTLLQHLVKHEQYDKACMVALAMCSGRRKSELVRFKLSYFDDENIVLGSLYKTPEKIKTKGRGDGKYIHCYTLVSQFKPYLDLWVQERKRLGIESEWLFPQRSNPEEHIKSDTLNSWAISFSKILNVDFYWHAMRHFMTTYLVKAGIPDSVIAEIIAWESTDMVRIYDDTSSDDKLSQYFDESGIKAKSTSIQDL